MQKKQGFAGCKNVLCIRPDNMGDVLMSTPAFRALKESFGCRITLLTSSVSERLAQDIPEVDEVLVYDMPWVKHELNNGLPPMVEFQAVASDLRERDFDAAVVFTRLQSESLPSIMLAYFAGIPRRLAYSRENPYHLLTHWIPDPEPFTMLRHQVQRDLDLVAAVDARTKDTRLSLRFADEAQDSVRETLMAAGVELTAPWILIHLCASEPKRLFPEDRWIEICDRLIDSLGCKLVFTGSASQCAQIDRIVRLFHHDAVNLAGKLSLPEFFGIVKLSPLVVSVNTSTVHLAAAAGTPVIVLYARTNPQHTPWQVPSAVFYYEIAEDAHSRNEVVRHTRLYFEREEEMEPTPEAVLRQAELLLAGKYIQEHR